MDLFKKSSVDGKYKYFTDMNHFISLQGEMTLEMYKKTKKIFYFSKLAKTSNFFFYHYLTQHIHNSFFISRGGSRTGDPAISRPNFYRLSHLTTHTIQNKNKIGIKKRKR